MLKNVFGSILLLLLIFLSACKETPNSEESLPELVRFDQLLMDLDTAKLEESFAVLEQKYPVFTDLFFSEILPFPGYATRNDTFFNVLNGFITDERINGLYGLVQEHYGDFDAEMTEINSALDQAKKWFPNQPDPRIYTFISEFSFQRFIFEDTDRDGLAIGLDLFLDPLFDYSILESGTNTFSKYLTRTYDREHLVKKTIELWVEDKMGPQQGDRVIDHMIYNGTKWYLLKEILELPDSIITEYPSDKLDWLENNEKEMWSFYLQNDWFYSTDQYVIKRLVFPAPNSTALRMPTDAPGQTGNYLGWQIMEQYIKRHPETDLNAILSMDAQQILEASKFKPGGNR